MPLGVVTTETVNSSSGKVQTVSMSASPEQEIDCPTFKLARDPHILFPSVNGNGNDESSASVLCNDLSSSGGFETASSSLCFSVPVLIGL